MSRYTVHVVTFMPIRHVQPFFSDDFHEIHKAEQHYVQLAYTELYTKWKMNVESRCNFSFTTLSEDGFYCSDFRETRVHSTHFS